MGRNTVDDPDALGDNKHGFIIRAVLEILKDGRPRSADDILEVGQKNGSLPKTLTRKSLYIHIVGFIDRQKVAGRPPLIVQDPKDRYFHINQPADTWPAFKSSYAPPSPSTIEAMIENVRSASRSSDPTAFELRVCEALTMVGFLVRHIGGYDAPDAVLTAPLGAQAYTAILECEVAQSGVVRRVAGVVEAARHRQAYAVDNAILIGPSFERLGTLDAELQTHDVGLWAANDLATVLSTGMSVDEIRPLFSAGRAENKLQGLMWERSHGQAIRIRTIASILIEEGWRAQVLFAQEGIRDEAPLLTEDTAMMIVDAWLQQLGAPTGCLRHEVKDAFLYLAHPLVNRAVYVSGRRDAIILTTERTLLDA